MYRITQTTDYKNVGTLIGRESFTIGDVVQLNDYIFRVDSVRIINGYFVLSNANYIVYCKKEI
jgi:hypothetical protein